MAIRWAAMAAVIWMAGCVGDAARTPRDSGTGDPEACRGCEITTLVGGSTRCAPDRESPFRCSTLCTLPDGGLLECAIR